MDHLVYLQSFKVLNCFNEQVKHFFGGGSCDEAPDLALTPGHLGLVLRHGGRVLEGVVRQHRDGGNGDPLQFGLASPHVVHTIIVICVSLIH